MKIIQKIIKGFRLLRITLIEIRLKTLTNRKYKLCKKLGTVTISDDCPADVSKFFSDLLNIARSSNSDSSEE